ncbi:MAG: hypothetical protein V4558_09115 [Gemmatimonadota bacterium]
MRSHSLVYLSLTLVLAGCGADPVVIPPPAPTPPPPSTLPIVASLEIPEVAELLPGDSRLITATARDAAGLVVEVPLVWNTSQPSVASASSLGGQHGLVVALAAGSTSVTVAVGDVRATRVVTVVDPRPATLSFETSTLTMKVGAELTLALTTRNAEGKLLPSRAATWSSADAALVSVSSTGVLTAHQAGVTEISASVGLLTARVTVTTVSAVLVIQPASIQLAMGDSTQLTAVQTGTDGQQLPGNLEVEWQSDHPEWVRVDASGWVHAVAANVDGVSRVAHITAKRADLTGSMIVQLLPLPGGAASGLRFVHAASELQGLVFVPSRGASALLRFGESADQPMTAGALRVDMLGFPPPITPLWQDFSEGLLPGQHLTLYATGGVPQGFLIAVSDLHDPVAPDVVLIRVLMASTYLRNWAPIDAFLVEVGEPIGGAMFGNFLELGSITDYSPRPARAYELVLVDGVVSGSRPGNGAELARFRIDPQGGRATTYAITGNGPGTFGLIAVVDP